MTLSLKQRAEHLVKLFNTPFEFNREEHILKALQEAYQEGRESGIRETAKIAVQYADGFDVEKRILALLNPPPKTGKP